MRRRGALAVAVSAFWIALGAAGQAAVQAVEERDPFVFGPRAGSVESVRPVLTGVLWDASHPLAMVGESTVAVGDKVADWRIVEIRPNGIVIQSGELRKVIAPGDSIPAIE